MSFYSKFLRQLFVNYVVGSAIAVLGVGSLFIFSSLQIPLVETWRLAGILFFSLLVMLSCERVVLRRHLRPIRSTFESGPLTLSQLQSSYLQTHRFPILAVQRIFGPHLLGLSIPGICLAFASIRQGWIDIPYYYIGFAGIGAVLIASLHAMIEFFLNVQAIRPMLDHIHRTAKERFDADLSLDGRVLVSIQKKFQLSAFLIGTFPLFLFALAGQIRFQNLSGDKSVEYWKWAAIILVVGVAFSSLGAWLLSRDIQTPIRNLYELMGGVKEGNFDNRAPDLYSDEFSKLVSGFNHMLDGLKTREKLNEQLLQSYFTTLAAALDARDPYTAGHSERVAQYSVRIGRLAGMDPSDLETLRKTALLHDIGKIGVRDAVLLKEGKLTDEEFDLIKLHPVLGEKILLQIEPAEAMAKLLPGVRSHHEQYNGRGYPDGLAGEAIPYPGRVIAIADAYDAMTSDRPYRKGMSPERALGILENGGGDQWDPHLTRLFVEWAKCELLPVDRAYAEVAASTEAPTNMGTEKA
ncbi:HD domain-containing protein [Cohnella endophytica]|uniref:HD domain-containing protein n=1 Tax=Cohnella endophytica TaxID=2419778 RepID=A0A494XU52_9BACL|nr:HD domain-containing phosphohydrolase [Cohnella endophytica]RKP54151.1 HD domain-containing protein [Cohnella endophytica]